MGLQLVTGSLALQFFSDCVETPSETLRTFFEKMSTFQTSFFIK